MNKRKVNDIVILVVSFLILVLLNVLASKIYVQWDWTEEQKYTLTPATEEIIDTIQQPVYIRVLLEGDFPAGFRRLQRAVNDFLRDVEHRNSLIEVEFVNPLEGKTTEVNKRKKMLSEQGIMPVNFRYVQGDETQEKLVYPYAIVSLGEQRINVNLLEEQTPGLSDEAALNNSISLLEYKFANAFLKLSTKLKDLIIFTTGHGELETTQMADYRNQLDEFYRFGTLPLDSTTFIPPSVKLIIIARPNQPFSEKEKFILDQYLMNGGNLMFLVDGLAVNLDSLQGRKQFIPPILDLNLDDLLFKYGLRIQPDLVLDLECSSIPLQVGMSGGTPQFDLFPWYYHPLIQPSKTHPISKNMGRVNMFFPSSIDTLRTAYSTKKTVLLASSQYTTRQLVPMRLNFEFLRQKPDPSFFSKKHLPVGVLVEGTFGSLYENRITESMMQNLRKLNLSYKHSSSPARLLLISDGDMIKNQISPDGSQFRPLGFNPYEKRLYDNRQFLVNATEYLINGDAVLSARNKEVKLRLLDKVRASEEKGFWQFVNLGFPLLFLLLFASLFFFIRKRKYS